ncbi:MAG TPA: heme lyase NrfEFG subunit NrfE, partial [Candidatus Aenigmarchaeota archaeon]|nr:heme lyase NrfEFG subunit NrfE [Candidatus Aenigmarchaeota archaeon]
GKLRVFKGERGVGELSPGKAYYPRMDEVTAEVDIKSGFLRDIYAILLDVSGEKASFRVYITPLVSWIWAGCWIMLIGSTFALFHRRRR